LTSTHIAKLKRIPCLRNARFVLIPESNLGNEAQEVAEHCLRQFVGLSVVSQKKDRYGVLTQGDIKRKYVFRFADLLAQGAISYHADLVSANPFVTNARPDEKAKASRMEFERQLRSFRRVHMLAPSLSSDPYVVFTGKAGPDNKNTSRMKDDMVMAALIGIYWQGQYKQRLVGERSYQRRFVRDTGRPLADVVRRHEVADDEFAERRRILEREEATFGKRSRAATDSGGATSLAAALASVDESTTGARGKRQRTNNRPPPVTE